MFSHDLTLPGSQAQSLHSNFARKLSETSVDWALPLQMSHWATWMSESCGPDRGLRFYDLPKSWILIDWLREDLQETLVLPFMRLSCRCSLHPILRRFLLYVHIHDLHWFTVYIHICNIYIYMVVGCCGYIGPVGFKCTSMMVHIISRFLLATSELLKVDVPLVIGVSLVDVIAFMQWHHHLTIPTTKQLGPLLRTALNGASFSCLSRHPLHHWTQGTCILKKQGQLASRNGM